jgi:hypothetical protein
VGDGAEESLTINLDVMTRSREWTAAGTTSLRPLGGVPFKVLQGDGQVLWEFDSRDGSHRALSAKEAPLAAVDRPGRIWHMWLTLLT